MSARRRLELLGVPLAAAAAIAVVLAIALGQATDAASAYQRGVGLLAIGGVSALAVVVRPAWPLSVGLALAVFSSHWNLLGFPVALDRVLIAIAVVSTLVRERRRTGAPLQTRPIDWLLMLVAVYALSSALWVGSLSDSEARFVLLDRFSLLAFVAFFVAPIAFREQRDRQVLLGTLVALGAYLGLTALIETTGPRGLLLPRYIDDPAVGIHFDRARGPFTEAAANGLALYACAVAACVAASSWHDRRWRLIAAGVAILCLLGDLFTVTRAVWLASAVATVIALIFDRRTRRLTFPALGLGAVAVVIAFTVVPGLQGHARDRSNDDPPVWDRKNSNAAALRMVAQRPLLGFGWGGFRKSSGDFYRQGDDFPLTLVFDVHNVFLANAVELGLIGAGLWALALILAVAGGVLRRGPPELASWRTGLVAVTVSYCTAAFTTPLGFAFPTLLLWTWAGVTWSSVRTTST